MNKIPIVSVLLIFSLSTKMQGLTVCDSSYGLSKVIKSKIHISGVLKLFADTPMFVVDGVVFDFKQLNKINQSDIESIDIINEFSSSIIYYKRVTGVVIITTRLGNNRTLKVIDKTSKSGLNNAVITFIKFGKKSAVKITDSAGVLTYNSKKLDFDSVVVSSAGYQTASFSTRQLKKSDFIIELKRNYIELNEVSVIGFRMRICRTLCCSIGQRLLCTSIGVRIDTSEENKKSKMVSLSAIKVFPNPVLTKGTFQLKFEKFKPGFYQIRLLNSSGQLYYSFQKQISSPNQTEQIHLSDKMSAGVYVLQIIDERKMLVQTSKIIVQ